MLVGQILVLLLVVAELTAWMSAIITLCFVWQSAILLNVVKKPHKAVIFFIGIGGAISIATNGKSLGLLLSMLHLLAFSFTIKSLELNTRKDFYQLILLAIFLIACSLIFYQSIWFSTLAIACFVYVLSVLLRALAPTMQMPEGLKHTSVMFIASLPLALTMFVLFPRLQPFWQMPIAESAKTGLGTEVKPGDIANLAKSTELAFRVNFEETPNSPQSLYWRAMTLPFFDGQGWQRVNGTGRQINWREIKNIRNLRAKAIDTSGPYYEYQLFAEPSNQHWLFALDIAQTRTQEVFQLYDYSLLSEKPIAKTFAYEAKSYYQAKNAADMSPQELKRYISLSGESNPRLRRYGRELSLKYKEPKLIVNHVLRQLASKPYYYSLQPPRLDGYSLDQFFFDTKTGFCEHYASSFAFLMRASGIPARLVTGYLGAKYNPQADYYSVYQYNAHAWLEVWYEGEGWVRIDPTASVAPERVVQGLEAALGNMSTTESNALFGRSAFANMQVVQFLKMQIEAIDYQWTKMVVGYSNEKQVALLKALFGNKGYWKIAAIFIGVLLLVITAFWLLNVANRNKNKHPKWKKTFLNLCEQMEKHEAQRLPEQTISSYFNALAIKEEKYKPLVTLAQLYYQLDYGPRQSNRQRRQQEKQFIAQVKTMRSLMR